MEQQQRLIFYRILLFSIQFSFVVGFHYIWDGRIFRLVFQLAPKNKTKLTITTKMLNINNQKFYNNNNKLFIFTTCDLLINYNPLLYRSQEVSESRSNKKQALIWREK